MSSASPVSWEMYKTKVVSFYPKSINMLQIRFCCLEVYQEYFSVGINNNRIVGCHEVLCHCLREHSSSLGCHFILYHFYHVKFYLQGLTQLFVNLYIKIEQPVSLIDFLRSFSKTTLYTSAFIFAFGFTKYNEVRREFLKA